MAWKTFISMLTHCSNEKQREVGSLYQNIFLYENIFFISKMDFRFYLEGASGKKYIFNSWEYRSETLKADRLRFSCSSHYVFAFLSYMSPFVLTSVSSFHPGIQSHTFFSSSSDSLTVNGKANLKFIHVLLKGKCPLSSQSNHFNIIKTNCSWNVLQICTGDKGKCCTHFQPLSKWWAGKLQACQSFLVPGKHI